ncbi:MAG: hypothetical protein KAU84_03315, partial [Thermoplasmatales archaeon]|nr:hypothetical protein [Thermoplasmatales archaeon]
KSSRFAHEIFTNAFPAEKRQSYCKYTTRNRTFCQNDIKIFENTGKRDILFFVLNGTARNSLLYQKL